MILNKQVIEDSMEKNNIKTYTELAERTHINKVQLSNMLSSKYNPIKSNVELLMQELNLTFDEITKSHDSIKSKKLHEQQLILDLGLEEKEQDLNSINYIDLNNKYRLDDFEDFQTFNPQKRFTTIETFAGAGGLSLGLKYANLESKFAIEIDKYASETLKINSKNTQIINKDINEILNEGLEKYNIDNSLDVLSGGYPCQSFSFAGKRNGLADTRGTLFRAYAIALGIIKPKVFIAENVKGLVTHDKGKTLYTMIKIFQKEGYQIFWNVFNSWDYDVAQKRQRIFIVGIRDDLVEKQRKPFKFPSPTGLKPVLKDVLKNVPDSPGVKYSEKKKQVMDLIPPGGCWVDLPNSIAKEYMGASYNSGGGRRGMARRLSWDEPSLTLTTSPNQKQTERCHPSETRPFTVREYARIQGFPDEWIFYGSVGNQYKQIGNAVPINLAKYIGLSVNNYLSQFDFN